MCFFCFLVFFLFVFWFVFFECFFCCLFFLLLFSGDVFFVFKVICGHACFQGLLMFVGFSIVC